MNPQLITVIVSGVLSLLEAFIRSQEQLKQPVEPVLLAERERLRKLLVDLAGQLGTDPATPPGPSDNG